MKEGEKERNECLKEMREAKKRMKVEKNERGKE